VGTRWKALDNRWIRRVRERKSGLFRDREDADKERFATRRLAAVAAALAVVATGCGPGGRPVPPPRGFAAVPVPRFPSGLSLLLSAPDAGEITAAAPGLGRQIVGGPATLVLGPEGQVPDPAGPPGRASLGAVFASYTAFRQELSNGVLPAGVKAVSYDPERWPATPAREQANPIGYMRLFARAARPAGLTVILVPGRDLMLVRGARCGQRRHETIDGAFLRCGLPAAAARLAPVFEVQVAPEELNPARAAAFTEACARQARAANPHVAVLATLSTVPLGHQVTGSELARAAAAIRPFVQGFQLNLTTASLRPALAFLRTARPRPAR
jgi:hypothetical protein